MALPALVDLQVAMVLKMALRAAMFELLALSISADEEASTLVVVSRDAVHPVDSARSALSVKNIFGQTTTLTVSATPASNSRITKLS